MAPLGGRVMLFDNKELAEWLEDCVKHILEGNADGIAFVAQSVDGEKVTAYYNAGPCRKDEIASHIQIDGMREVIDVNSRETD